MLMIEAKNRIALTAVRYTKKTHLYQQPTSAVMSKAFVDDTTEGTKRNTTLLSH